MSFSGHGSGGRGRGSGEHGDPSQSSTRALLTMESLIAEVRAVLDDAHDTEVHRLMQQHFHDTGANDRLSAREILRATAFMLHSVRNRGERLSARRALILLVLGGWNQTLAENLFEQMGEGNERAVLEQNGVHDQEQEEMEGESDEDVNSDADRLVMMSRLNRGIDRGVAKRYEPDESKLSITIRHPRGRQVTFNYPKQPVDWARPVKALNRWRSQVLRRNIGPGRPFRTHFHPDEKEWLFQEHIRFENQRRGLGLAIDYSAMRWHDIVTRFNQEFAGKILPGASNPRQARTHVALRTERSRIKKITDHTGIPLKSQRVTAEVDETDDEEESDDEMDYGQPYPTRRGDPPPGKPPRRDDDDDQQGGGVGGLEPARDLVMT